MVDAGYFFSIACERIGRATRLPLQFGHWKFKTDVAQEKQNVHSKVQINASEDSGGKFLLQHSQFGLNSSMMSFVPVVHNSLQVIPAKAGMTH